MLGAQPPVLGRLAARFDVLDQLRFAFQSSGVFFCHLPMPSNEMLNLHPLNGLGYTDVSGNTSACPTLPGAVLSVVSAQTVPPGGLNQTWQWSLLTGAGGRLQ